MRILARGCSGVWRRVDSWHITASDAGLVSMRAALTTPSSLANLG